MDLDLLEPVLQEVLEELKETNKLNRENTQALVEQQKSLALIEKKQDQKLLPPAASDTKQIEKLISESAANIMKFISEQPKEFVIHKRILLFPEHNAAEFYRLFYGRLFKWLTVIIISCFLYQLGKDYIAAIHEKNWYREAYDQLRKEKVEMPHKPRQKSKG